MKIALIYDAIYPFVRGGAERRIYEIGRRLAKKHEVHLVGWTYWQGGFESPEPGLMLRGLGRPPRLYDSRGRRRPLEALLYSLKLSAFLRQNRFDLLDCSSIPYLPAFVARSIRPGTPLVVTWHEYLGNSWNQYLPEFAWMARHIESGAARLGRTRIAVSRFTASRLPSGPPTVVIRNGVDRAVIDSIKPADDGPELLFVGRLLPHKRVELLLGALSILDPSYRLGIVGTGPEESRLRKRAMDVGLDDRLRFYGEMPEADLLALMKASGVLVQPSAQEGQSIVVLEAMACGLPPVVVRSPNSGAGENFENEVSGLEVDAGTEALAAAVCVARNKDRRAALSKHARTAAQQFDWDDIAAQTERLYTSIT